MVVRNEARNRLTASNSGTLIINALAISIPRYNNANFHIRC